MTARDELVDLVTQTPCVWPSSPDGWCGAHPHPECVVANLIAHPDVVLRALGGERDDSRRTAFHDWWIVPVPDAPAET